MILVKQHDNQTKTHRVEDTTKYRYHTMIREWRMQFTPELTEIVVFLLLIIFYKLHKIR